MNSTKFELSGLENPESYLQEILIEWKFLNLSIFPNLSPELRKTALKSEIFGSKNGINRYLISQIA